MKILVAGPEDKILKLNEDCKKDRPYTTNYASLDCFTTPPMLREHETTVRAIFQVPDPAVDGFLAAVKRLYMTGWEIDP